MRWLTVLLAASLAAGCGGSSTEPRPAKPTARASAPASGPLLTAIYQRGGPWLREIDRDTLAPLKAPAVKLRGYGWASARSPDGRSVAISASARGRVQIVDVRPLRTRTVLHSGLKGEMTALAWSRPDALLAIHTERGEPGWLLTADPSQARFVTRMRLPGPVYASAAGTSTIAAVTGPPDDIGPGQLTIAHSDGSRRTVTLPRTHVGQRYPRKYTPDKWLIPGLVVDEARGRVLVVPPTSTPRVMEIPIHGIANSQQIVDHDLTPPRSLASKLRDIVEPPAGAKMTEGSNRAAFLFEGSGALLVTGYDGERNGTVTPFRTAVVDTKAWTSRPLGRRATQFAVADDRLVVIGRRLGVRAYDADGNELWRALDGKNLTQFTLAAGRVYATFWKRRVTHVLDLETGKELARVRRVPQQLIDP